METISFTKQVKEEIVNREFVDEYLRAVLASFIKINGSVSFHNKETSLILKTENAAIAKFIYKIANKLYGITARFAYSKTMNFKKKTVYSIIFDNEADYLLSDLEISFLDGKISKTIVCNDEMISGYFCGAFLAAGSVNSPVSSNYHLEVALTDENFAKWFVKLFLKYKASNFEAKITYRREMPIVYIKKADKIVDFLIMIGATQCALDFENIRLERDSASNWNRLQNLDDANYNKTANASQRQIEDIKLINKLTPIDTLKNEKMRELMKLRLENEDSSLNELASLLSEKVGVEVSRSNINHLFRKIHETAEQYRKRQKELNK
ncbi:MAG: DNA-binding protein WhiA [Bacilli bacterium]|nr:DNA-binding protein WhiA [Bacilli bacterium]